MKVADIEVGGYYLANVSGRRSVVRIIGHEPMSSGWDAINLGTGRRIWIKSGRRLQKRIPDHLLNDYLNIYAK